MKQKLLINQSPKFDNNKLADKLSELILVNKEKESIDNGDVGSTKDYPSETEDDQDLKINDLYKMDTFKTAKGEDMG